MDHLPLSDIPMLVSSINFLLRDEEFENIDQKMDRLLESEGYAYKENLNGVK